ncbi:MAG TPA: Xaa-Pro aminopeptidase [Polyangiaceae bacterium]|nr:Xaa-Pro aminopeptidase [Polyangiaceae bacterium]
MWPVPSDPKAFADRRRKLAEPLEWPALFVAGRARPRNFQANLHGYRAESHFLYFVGRPIEGAALLIEPQQGAVLYAPEPDPEEELWTGRQASLAELERELGITTKPISDLAPPSDTATLPAQDLETAFWQSEMLGRDIEPGSGPELKGPDRALAEAVITLRLKHDAAAIAQLRQAAEATRLAHAAGALATRPRRYEAEVRGAMEGAILASGCVCAYQPIVTVAGEVLHNNRYDGAINEHDLLLADVGAETPEGWAGDVTRVWPAGTKFSTTQREIYEVVLQAQLAAIAAVRPGVRYLEVHRVAGKAVVRGLIALGILRGDADDLYERGAAALFFPHGIGHLIGLDVHDMEDLGDLAGYAPGRERSESFGDRYLRLDRDLEAGMAVTIEPGYYAIKRLLQRPEEVGDLESSLNRSVLARYADVRGIRIEDDVLVTKDGAEVLTAGIPKTVAEIEAARAS